MADDDDDDDDDMDYFGGGGVYPAASNMSIAEIDGKSSVYADDNDDDSDSKDQVVSWSIAVDILEQTGNLITKPNQNEMSDDPRKIVNLVGEDKKKQRVKIDVDSLSYTEALQSNPTALKTASFIAAQTSTTLVMDSGGNSYLKLS